MACNRPPDRLPPGVFDGIVPPIATFPSAINGPPSPFGQKPRSSSQHNASQLNPSYNSATSTSDGFRPLRRHRFSPQYFEAINVKSSHWSQSGRGPLANSPASTLT